MRSPGVLVIGYGSLMSATGLARDGDLPVRSLRRVELVNARRGYGKASIHADRFAMVVEAADPARPIAAKPLDQTEAGSAPQAAAIEIDPHVLPTIARREGYSSERFAHLQRLAGAAGVAEYLAALMWESGASVTLYRKRLHARLGYTSPHYIPHPIRIGPDTGIIFLAPGSEGSGSPEVVPLRVATGVTELLSTAGVWQRKPNQAQLDYIATCLLAEAHGVNLDDLRGDIPKRLGELLAASLPSHESERATLSRLRGLAAEETIHR